MKTTIKNLPTVTSKTLETKNPLDSKHILLALTLCLSSSVSFNEAYCMEDIEMAEQSPLRHVAIEVARDLQDQRDLAEYQVNNNASNNQQLNIHPVGENIHSVFEDPEFIKLWHGIKTADQKLQKQFDQQRLEGLENKPVTVLLETSGVGKTALHKYLRGIPLVARESGDFLVPFRIDSLNDEDAEEREIVIGQTYNAETTYPALRKGYFDCPGFEDTRGITQKIINAYSIKKVFEQVKDFNLLLVASSSQFADRGSEFLKLIDNLGEMFNKDLSILNALNIVVTKSDPIPNNMERLKNTFKGILDRNDLSHFQRQALEFMSTNENQQITFFDRPLAKGPISSSTKLMNGITYLHGGGANIEENERKVIPNIGLNYTAVNADGAIYLEGLNTKLLMEISQSISSFYEELKDGKLVQNFIASNNGTAQEFRNKFQDIVGCFTAETPKWKKLQRIFQLLQSKGSEQFDSLMGIRKFLKHIDENLNITLDREELSNTLFNLEKYFGPFADDINEPDYSEGQLTLSGNIIGISDILSHIAKHSETKQLNICGFKSLLIDSDLTLPSTNLVLASPFLNIVTDQENNQLRSINLRGRDGDPKNKGRAYNGGNAVIQFDTISHGEALTMDLSGGDGGIPGIWALPDNHHKALKRNLREERFRTCWHWDQQTNGGYVVYGKDGSEGRPGSVQKILKKRPENLEATTKTGLFTTEKFYRSGTLGKPGKDVYELYKGPKGGTPGSIIFKPNTPPASQDDVSGNDYGINLILNTGNDGPSALGIPGKGGRHGNPIWAGTWVEGPFGSYWKNGDPHQENHLGCAPDGNIKNGTLSGRSAIKTEDIDSETCQNKWENQNINDIEEENRKTSISENEYSDENDDESVEDSSESVEEKSSDTNKRSRDESEDDEDLDSPPQKKQKRVLRGG